MKYFVLVLVASFVALVAGKCGEIYEQGASEEGKKITVEMHNKYRKMVANGEVPNQPRGTNLLRMSYDKRLEDGAKVVNDACKADHVILPDDRFLKPGQNIFARWTSSKNCTQDWPLAVDAWFNEYKEFKFPNKKLGSGPIGHYTQLVWAESFLIGCDFICFNDLSKKSNPYARFYTCNYGPGGNVGGEEPYKVGDESGCEDLCEPDLYKDTMEVYDGGDE